VAAEIRKNCLRENIIGSRVYDALTAEELTGRESAPSSAALTADYIWMRCANLK